jgi:WD repeat-containing protein 48
MANHCFTTYNHSSSPVWCLATNSPTFNTFWAGSKDGWVYKISSPDEEGSECIALCKEDHPILNVRFDLFLTHKIAAIEDRYIWVATTSSSINRYPDVSFSPTGTFVVPDACFCKRDFMDEPETESVYSKPISVEITQSEPILSLGNPEGDAGSEDTENIISPLWPNPESVIQGASGIRKASLLNNKRHVITLDTTKNVQLWDIISCTKIKDLGMVDFEKACENENTQEWVSNWCTIDTKHGVRPWLIVGYNGTSRRRALLRFRTVLSRSHTLW